MAFHLMISLQTNLSRFSVAKFFRIFCVGLVNSVLSLRERSVKLCSVVERESQEKKKNGYFLYARMILLRISCTYKATNTH